MKRNHFATLTAVCAFVLIVAGGLVTSTGSSLAVPDWPLSYGQYFPPMVGGVLFEHGHRMIAGTVGLMTLVLAVWVWMTEPRRWVRWLTGAALGGIVLQAILGGITVLYQLPHSISIAHACLGQTVFCLLVALAQFLSLSNHGGLEPSPHPRPIGVLDAPKTASGQPSSDGVSEGEASANGSKPPFRFLHMIVVLAVYVQLILGAVVRHTGTGVAAHILWAVATAGIILWACYKTISGDRGSWLTRPAWFLVSLIPIQIVLGFAALMLRSHAAATWTFWPVALRTGHVAGGAAILAISVVWWLRAWSSGRFHHDGSAGGSFGNYIELCKPRIAVIVVVTSYIGYWLAGGIRIHPEVLSWMILGVGLASAASGVLNQAWEKDSDALMPRTQNRPLPQARVTPERAWAFGLALASISLLVLAWKVNGLACGLTAFTIASYVLLYTPLKKRTPQSTWIGAVSGAMPPVIGWAAARGTLESQAWALFAIQFLWQIPHFLSLFWIYRDQYARAGFKVMPVVHPRGGTTACQIAIHSFALIPASLTPLLCGVAGVSYGWAALALGVAFLLLGLKASWTMAVIDARRLFLASLAYLPILFGTLAWARIP